MLDVLFFFFSSLSVFFSLCLFEARRFVCVRVCACGRGSLGRIVVTLAGTVGTAVYTVPARVTNRGDRRATKPAKSRGWANQKKIGALSRDTPLRQYGSHIFIFFLSENFDIYNHKPVYIRAYRKILPCH